MNVAFFLALLPALAAAQTPAPDDPPERKLERAAQLATSNRADQQKALALVEEVLATPNLPDDQKIAAHTVIVEVHRRNNKLPDALKAAQKLRELLPQSKPAEQTALLLQADILRAQNKRTDALARVRELVQRQPNSAEGHLRLSELLVDDKAADAYAAAVKAAEFAGAETPLLPRILMAQNEAAWRAQDHKACITALTRLLEPGLTARRDDWATRELRRRLGACHQALKQYEPARAVYTEAEKLEKDDNSRPAWALAIGDTFTEEGKYDQALAAYERVFTDYRIVETWYPTQRKIVDALARKGDFAAALQAAHLLFDGAPDSNAIAESARLVAELFKAVDQNVARANLFLNYQRFGPTGEDGKPGTADDLAKNPLDQIGYPDQPARKKAFEAGRAAAGDSAAAARYRALGFIYTGKPREALRHFADAFGRCNSNEFQARGDELVLIGVRAARGHPIGLEDVYQFLNYGPTGPDGKPNTPDDLADPIAPLLK